MQPWATPTYAEPMTAQSPTFVELLGRPLRLLVLCYEMPPIGGGTGVACSQVMRILAQRPDLRIDVISSGTGKRLEVVREAGMTLHLLPVGKRDLSLWQPDELVRWMVGAARRARELVAEEPFDLCHCWSGFPSGLVGWWLRDRQPYLVSLRGSDVPGYNRRLRLLDPLLLAPHGAPGMARCRRRVRGEPQPAGHGAGHGTRCDYRHPAQRRRRGLLPPRAEPCRHGDGLRRPPDRAQGCGLSPRGHASPRSQPTRPQADHRRRRAGDGPVSRTSAARSGSRPR